MMQQKMMAHQLSKDEIDDLLAEVPVGVLSTIDTDGTPYGIPIHFVPWNGAIYIHCKLTGQKLDNIRANARVCLTAYHMDGIILDPEDRPCKTNTAYSSAIVQGKAQIISDAAEKRGALEAIVRKYTPHLSGKEIPDGALDRTAVVRIDIESMTGKYGHRG